MTLCLKKCLYVFFCMLSFSVSYSEEQKKTLTLHHSIGNFMRWHQKWYFGNVYWIKCSLKGKCKFNIHWVCLRNVKLRKEYIYNENMIIFHILILLWNAINTTIARVPSTFPIQRRWWNAFRVEIRMYLGLEFYFQISQ